MKVQRFATITTIFCALTIAGCSDPGTDELDGEALEADALDFRMLGGNFWDWGANNAANGEIEVHEGEDVDVPDCLIWDIDTAGVSRQTSPGVLVERLAVDDNEVFEVDPVTGIAAAGMSCEAEASGPWWNKRFKLVESNGDVALTVWWRFVFIGDVQIPNLGDPALGSLLQNDVAFSFKYDHIYVGPWWDGDIVATADANLNKANPMRRLLLGALAAGECGSLGLP